MNTKEDALALFDYDAKTGKLYWKTDRAYTTIKAGTEAGSNDHLNYRILSVAKKRYKAHRVVWLIEKGRWPSGMLDHINRNPSDNRIENLREVTPKENTLNTTKQKKTSSQYFGVYWAKRRQKWQASAQVNGKTKWLGYYDSEHEAAIAREKFLKRNPGSGNFNFLTRN